MRCSLPQARAARELADVLNHRLLGSEASFGVVGTTRKNWIQYLSARRLAARAPRYYNTFNSSDEYHSEGEGA